MAHVAALDSSWRTLTVLSGSLPLLVAAAPSPRNVTEPAPPAKRAAPEPLAAMPEPTPWPALASAAARASLGLGTTAIHIASSGPPSRPKMRKSERHPKLSSSSGLRSRPRRLPLWKPEKARPSARACACAKCEYKSEDKPGKTMRARENLPECKYDTACPHNTVTTPPALATPSQHRPP
eukprot:358020-Chlamydomonas_euryale.AAC.7